MVYRLPADCLIVIHLAFVVFVVAGGFLIMWRPSVRWIHLPAAAWGPLIEFTGWICPLTPWEQVLRLQAGQVGYGDGFIDHYILPILYPQGLTPGIQIALGFLVIGVNVGIYAFVGYRRAGPRRGLPIRNLLLWKDPGSYVSSCCSHTSAFECYGTLHPVVLECSFFVE